VEDLRGSHLNSELNLLGIFKAFFYGDALAVRV